MIYSRLRLLKFAKEESEARKLTFQVLNCETGLAVATLQRLMSREPIERIDGRTIAVLCGYFGVGVGDLLTLAPDGSGSSNEDQE